MKRSAVPSRVAAQSFRPKSSSFSCEPGCVGLLSRRASRASTHRFSSQQQRNGSVVTHLFSSTHSTRFSLLSHYVRSHASAKSDTTLDEIKEAVSPLFYERRILELWDAAERNLGGEQWSKAEDRLFTVLENVDNLKATLKEQGKEETTSQYTKEEFLGRANIRLAFSQHQQGKRDYAEEHYTTGIKQLRASLGNENPEVAHAMLNLSEVLSLLSRVDEAEKVISEAIAIIEKTHEPDHEILGGAYANLGGFICAQGRLKEAIVANEKALTILDKALGPDNEFTLSALSNCLRMYEDLGDKEGVAKLKKRYGERHKQFVDMHRRNEDYSQAEVDKMKEEWDAEAPRKVLDPEGLYKPRSLHRDQLISFINAYRDESGKPLSADELALALKELEGTSDEELQEMMNQTPDQIMNLVKELRAQPPDLSEPIGHPFMNFERPPGGEKESGEGGFVYDEKEPDDTRPRKGHWRRVASARRRAATEKKRVGFLDDNDLTEAQAEDMEKRALNNLPPSLPREVLNMMDKEEELTQRQFEREGGKMEQEAQEAAAKAASRTAKK